MRKGIHAFQMLRSLVETGKSLNLIWQVCHVDVSEADQRKPKALGMKFQQPTRRMIISLR